MSTQGITYEIAVALKNAGFPQEEKSLIQSPNKPEWIAVPTLSELIEAVKNKVNELAIGWNDSGCFWHFQYGERGSGNMMEGFGEKYSALDSDTLEEAIANLWLKLNKR